MRIDDALLAAGDTPALRRAAVQILARALEAVDPYAVTASALQFDGQTVRLNGAPVPLAPRARVVVVGGGKAGGPMARAAEDAFGERIAVGLVVVKRGYTVPLRRIALREAGHPLPDAAGEAAAAEILRMVSGLSERDLVVCLISGGGSALLPLPRERLTLDDKVHTTQLLLGAGADITEINTVRKHLSRIKGGQLARAASPARLLSVVISDVVGSPLDAIASGPTVPDPTTFADALAVLRKYGLMERVPGTVRAELERGDAGLAPETPKPGDPAFRRATTAVIAENRIAAAAAAAEAGRLGFHTRLLSTYVEGEAKEVGRVLAGIAREIAASGHPEPRPACVVCGGETTVTLSGTGKGGRNQELALSAGRTLAGLPAVLVVSFATDGTDGPTDAAGGVADGTSWARARAAGLDPARHLAEHNAYPLLKAIGDMIRVGPTNTNVNDLMLVLCGTAPGP
jgi:glycerate 2-kinase